METNAAESAKERALSDEEKETLSLAQEKINRRRAKLGIKANQNPF